MTWTPAGDLVNPDFASSGTGWTVVTGTPRYSTLTVNSVSKTCFNGATGADDDDLVSLSQTLAIPADTKKARVTTWYGGSFADYDAGVVTLILYDGSANIVGGVSTTQVDNTVFYQEAILECIVPSTAVSAVLLLSAVRVGSGGAANNGVVSEANVDWFIDAGLTIYTAPNFLVNGTFETGDTTGWSSVSGSGITVTSGALLIAGAYSCISVSGGTNNTIHSRMTAEAPITFIPPTAQGVYLTGLSNSNQGDISDSVRARLDIYDADGVLLETHERWLQMGNIGIRQWTLWVDVLPVGAATIEVDFDFWLGATGAVCNASIDNLELVFFSEIAPVDISPIFQVRLPNGTWYNLSPRFEGAGTSGWVRDPGVELGYFLADDGAFHPVAAGSGIMIGTWGKDTGTSASDPGAGDFTLDDTTYAGATAMYISYESSAGLDVEQIVALWTAGAYLYLEQIGDATKAVIYEVSAFTDNTTWAEIGLTYVDSIGTFFDDGAQVGVIFVPPAGVASVAWGSITGTLSAQTDLQAALDLKLEHVVEDLTPEFAADLDMLVNSILNVQRIDIPGLATYGTGAVISPYPALVNMEANRTWNYQISGIFGDALVFPPGVTFGGTQTIQKALSIVGAGFLFFANPTIKNDPAIASINFSGFYALASTPIYQADNQATTAGVSFIEFFSSPVFECINGGSMNAASASIATVSSAHTIGANVNNFGQRHGIQVVDTSGSGTLTNMNGYSVANLTKATNHTDVLLGATSTPSGTHSIYQSNEWKNRWNAAQQYKVRGVSAARTLDSTDHIIEYTGAANADMQLPAANTCQGREYVLKKTAAGHPRFVPAGADTIDGAANLQLTVANSARTIVSNGTATWRVIASYL